MSVVLVRRRYACAYEQGPRPVARLVPGPAMLARTVGAVAGVVTAYCGGVTTERLVALTYDDGPDPVHTPRVLDELAAAGVPATFLVLTDHASRHPELIRRMIAEGHEVGLHGVDHARLSTLPWGVSVRRILAARRRLRHLTGRPVQWYRPAYGGIRLNQLVALRAAGLDVPVWTAWARDWEDAPLVDLADRAATAMHSGGVLLLHDAASGLPADTAGTVTPPVFDRGALTAMVAAAVRAQGLRALTLSDLKAAAPAARVPWFETRRKAQARAHAG